MVAGHFTATYSAGKLLGERYPVFANIPLLIFGAFLPDIIDKPVSRIFSLPARGVAHSLLVEAAVFGLAYIILVGYREGTLSVAAGAALHLMEDLVDPVVLLWPLLGGWPQMPEMTLTERLEGYYLKVDYPLLLSLELISYPIFLYFLYLEKISSSPPAITGDAVVDPE